MQKNIFQRAVSDIFSFKDFLEKVTIDGEVYDCIASALSADDAFTSAGLSDIVSFTLDIQLPLHKPIKPDDKVYFRGKQYKVALVVVDSAPASVRIHLRSTSEY